MIKPESSALRALWVVSIRRLTRAWRAPWSLGYETGTHVSVWVYVALIIAFIFMVGVTFDRDVASYVLSLPHWLITLNVNISKLGDSAYIFLVSVLWCVVSFFYAAHLTRPRLRLAWLVQMQRTFYIFAVNASSGLFSIFAKNIIGRARPSDLGPLHFEPFTFLAKFASFPSGHSITAFATAYAVGLIYPRLRLWLFLIAALVGASRVIIHAHYVSDVLAGACIGLLWAYAVARVLAFSRLGLMYQYNHFSARGQYLLDHLKTLSIIGVTL
jgi:membrane-associated phospholipid phosphatase